jgi:hypothetical protein
MKAIASILIISIIIQLTNVAALNLKLSRADAAPGAIPVPPGAPAPTLNGQAPPVPTVVAPLSSGSAVNSLTGILNSAMQSAMHESSAAFSQAQALSQSEIPATQLLPGSSGSSGSGCVGSCGKHPIHFKHEDDGLTIDDAVRPVDEWITDFKHRTADSTDILPAAKATVRPLIDRLKRNQQQAVQKLIDSNEEILMHVEESVTEHVYNLLKAQHIADDKQAQSEAVAAKLEEAQAAVADSQMRASVVAEHSEHSGSASSSSSSAAAGSGSSGSKL